MTIPPKAVEAACKAYGAHQPYLPANMQRALKAAEPFIRAAVIEECWIEISEYEDVGVAMDALRKLAKEALT